MSADIKFQGDRARRKIYAIAGGSVIRVFDWNPEEEEFRHAFFRVQSEMLAEKEEA